MSLIIAIYVPTGVVLSGDSRTTGTRSQQVPNPQKPAVAITVQTSIVFSDSAEKLFLLFGCYGVGTFGDALIRNMPIAHYMQEFEAQTTNNPPTSTMALATALLQYFRGLQPISKVSLIVVGYDGNDPWVIIVDVFNNTIERGNFNPQTNQLDYGILRGGEIDIVNRLLSQPQFLPPFKVMNLQDAVDYSRHLIRSTIDQMRFEPRFATVGGPVDTLVVTRTDARFLSHKDLICT